MQRVFREKLHHLAEQATGQIRALGHQLVGIDTKIADVISERAQTDAGVLVEIAFAQFQEAAERAQYLQITVDGFTGQRVEHHIHARAMGVGENFIAIRERTRIVDVRNAHHAQEIAFFVGAGRGVDFGADRLGELDRGDADATCATVDQDFLAFFQAG